MKQQSYPFLSMISLLTLCALASTPLAYAQINKNSGSAPLAAPRQQTQDTSSNYLEGITLPPPEASDAPLDQLATHSNVDVTTALNYNQQRYDQSANQQYKNFLEQQEWPTQTALPSPNARALKTTHLTLQDAILLALRNNPDVQNEELTRVLDKYALDRAYSDFQPHLSLQGNALWMNGNTPTYDFAPKIQLGTMSGTKIEVGYAQSFAGLPGAATLNVTQPLLKGFGIGNYSLANANNTELNARLSYKQGIIQMINQVIQGYLGLVEQYANLDIQYRALQQTEKSMKDYELQVKAGKMAPSDLYNEHATAETTRLSWLQSKSQITSNYQNFLAVLGLDSNAHIDIDQQLHLTDIRLPSLDQAITLALRYNLEYQQAKLQLENNKRQVLIAKNQLLPEVDLTAQASLGNNSGYSPSGGSSSLPPFTGQRSIGLNVTVPIDDTSAKEGLASAEISLQQNQNTLLQKNRQIAHDVTDKMMQLQLQKQQILTSAEAATMSEKAYEAAKIRLHFGRATIFEVTTLQNQALAAKIGAVLAKVNYFNQITALDTTLGITLNRWNIHLRY